MADELGTRVHAHLEDAGVRGFEIFSETVLAQRFERLARVRGVQPDPEQLRGWLQAADVRDETLRWLLAPPGGASENAAQSLKSRIAEILPLFVREVCEGIAPRVWIIGCHDGSDVFSTAAQLLTQLEAAEGTAPTSEQRSAEALDDHRHEDSVHVLGPSREAMGHGARAVRVFGTDIDGPMLRHAATGRVASELQHRFGSKAWERFVRCESEQCLIGSSLRSHVVFAAHDLLHHPPLSRLGLVVIRYPLSTLAAAAKAALVDMLAFSVVPGGRVLLCDGSLPGLEASFEPSPEFAGSFRRLWRPTRSLPVARARRIKRIDPGSHLAALHGETRGGVRSHLITVASLELACRKLAEEQGKFAYIIEATGRIVVAVRPLPPRGQIESARALRGRTLEDPIHALIVPAISQCLKDAQRTSETSGPLPLADLWVHAVGDFVRIELIPLDLPAELLFVVTLLPLGARSQDQAEPELGDRSALAGSRVHEPQRVHPLAREVEAAHAELLAARLAEVECALVEADRLLAESRRDRDQAHRQRGLLEARLQLLGISTVVLDRELRVLTGSSGSSGLLPLTEGDAGRSIRDFRHDLQGVDLGDWSERVLASGRPAALEVQRASGQGVVLRAVPQIAHTAADAALLIGCLDLKDAQVLHADDAESLGRFQELVDRVDEVMWIRDQGGRVLRQLSAACRQIFGLLPADLVDIPGAMEELIHPDDLDAYENWLQGARLGRSGQVEYRLLLPGGEERWIFDRAFPIVADGRVLRISGIAQDVTLRRTAEKQLAVAREALEVQAHRDPLTGLLNRRGLERALGRELERARRQGGRISAVLLDCDDFKSVNDQLGHAAGDVALRLISAQLGAAMRSTDHLGRIGGDEFLAVLPDTREAEAWQLAERLRLSLAESSIRIGEREMRLTASLGVAAILDSVVSLEEVIAETQHALKLSKKAGKNRVSAHSADQPEGVVDRESELAVLAISTGMGIEVYRQAIMGLACQGVVGQEFLVRGPLGPYRSPADLFRLAMERNCLTRLDLQCVRKCLEAAALETTSGVMHLNILPSTLLELDVEKIGLIFARMDRRHEYVVEISEQQFIGDPRYLVPSVNALRDIGLKVAIDDVGFGRSSLESLVLLDPDVIKIDRGFVHGASQDVEKRRRLERLLDVANHLSPRVIAEGVEEEADCQLLIALGVSFAQGYFWSRPEPVLMSQSSE